MSKYLFDKITIIGLGLIGSSVARAVHENKLAGSVVGCDGNEVSLAFARKNGFIDSALSDAQLAVADADLVIISTPPSTLGEVAESIAPNLKHGAIVMDMASVKQPAINAIAPHIPPHAIFIPAHPIAGSEQAGVRAGRADLFVKKRIIITPDAPPEDELLKKITSFWQAMGARIEGMPAEIHDMLYGYMSHLPQLIAFCLKKPLGIFFEKTDENPVYKSFLRIAHSSPALWAEIFAQNKDNILKGLDRYIDVVSHVHAELKNAPEGEESKNDALLANSVLFPRIVASCLVTTVMEAEKNAGFPFARYAGTGFADLTAPTLVEPEADIEQISAQYKLVEVIVGEFLLRLKTVSAALAIGTAPDIERAING